MIDVVIPYRNTDDGLQLKYALRSMEKHLAGVGNLFIVGCLPPNLKASTFIYCPWLAGNGMGGKEKNIYEKVLLAACHPGVSDPFLYMNDDHYLLQDVVANEFPYYYMGDLSTQALGNTTPYNQTLKNTMELQGIGPAAKYFDVHCPILFNKEQFKITFPQSMWKKEWGYCMKTLYCYATGINKTDNAIFTMDLKYRKPGANVIPSGLPFFSTDDKAMDKGMVGILEISPGESL